MVAEHAHLLGSSSVTIIRELFAADAAAAAAGGAAADSLTSSAASELPSPKKDVKVRRTCRPAGWTLGTCSLLSAICSLHSCG